MFFFHTTYQNGVMDWGGCLWTCLTHITVYNTSDSTSLSSQMAIMKEVTSQPAGNHHDLEYGWYPNIHPQVCFTPLVEGFSLHSPGKNKDFFNKLASFPSSFRASFGVDDQHHNLCSLRIVIMHHFPSRIGNNLPHANYHFIRVSIYIVILE